MNNRTFLIFPFILLLGLGITFAQKTVTGTIVANGLPLPGVSVIEQGTVNGVTSDFDGNYTITLQNDESSLIFSYIGYVTQTLATTSATLNVILLEDVASA